MKGGKWSGGEDDWVYTHESGHLIELPDDYSNHPDGSPKADKGHEGQMMGDYEGKVHQHEIDDVLGKIKCPFEK